MLFRHAFALAVIPLAIVAFGLFGPLHTDAIWHHSGVVFDAATPILDGQPSIEPNMGVTSQALGRRAAEDVLHGRWPLWNPFEGLGAPLLGEMQAAALFPPTLLLALPHGQTIEQALLQGLAGLGCFLFFRRFGLGTRAALAGALTFEVNGVFAWLRNAIFNPVAALPWLFLVVECLLSAVVSDLPWRRRAAIAALGAVVAALAVSAGFPEEVYLYGLMLAAWTGFRMTRLDGRQNRRLIFDLALMGVLAVLLSAPVLVAFKQYLGHADLAGHSDDGFAQTWLEGAATLQYIAPYVYGRLFATDVPVVNSIVGGTGGYTGFLPVMFAFGCLCFRARRSTKITLLAWIALAVGVSEGVPVLHDAFMLIPLTKITAVYRYLNASWIFALIFLSAMFVDDIADCPPSLLDRRLFAAATLGLLALVLALACSWSVVSDLLAAGGRERRAMMVALAVTLGLAALAVGATLGRDPRATASRLSAILVLEALTWFAYPYLSSPRGGRLDMDLIAFLRSHIDNQRVVGTLEAGIGVNYGSYFGIAALNYDDLPVPKATTAYVRSHLDPYAASTSFTPGAHGATEELRNDEMGLLRAQLPAYGRAGVRFVLAGPDFGTVNPYGPNPDRGLDQPLSTGRNFLLRGPVRVTMTAPVAALVLPLASKDAAASGQVSAKVCAGEDCTSGVADIASADDRRNLSILLDRHLRVASGQILTVEIVRIDGSGAVTLSGVKHSAGDPAGSGPGGDASVPEVRLRDDALHLAYTGRTMSVYALSEVRPYASAENCDVRPSTRDSIDVSCAAPSRLTRLELAMPGWSAEIDGRRIPMETEDGVFQVIDLPAGASRVQFRFVPLLFLQSVWAATLALALVVAAVVRGFGPATRLSAGSDPSSRGHGITSRI